MLYAGLYHTQDYMSRYKYNTQPNQTTRLRISLGSTTASCTLCIHTHMHIYQSYKLWMYLTIFISVIHSFIPIIYIRIRSFKRMEIEQQQQQKRWKNMKNSPQFYKYCVIQQMWSEESIYLFICTYIHICTTLFCILKMKYGWWWEKNGINSGRNIFNFYFFYFPIWLLFSRIFSYNISHPHSISPCHDRMMILMMMMKIFKSRLWCDSA